MFLEAKGMGCPRSSRRRSRNRTFVREFAASFLAVLLGGVTALPISAFLVDSLDKAKKLLFPDPDTRWKAWPSERAESLGIGQPWKQYSEVVRIAEKTLADHIERVRSRDDPQPEMTTAATRDAIRFFTRAVKEARADLWASCCRGSRVPSSQLVQVWLMIEEEAAQRFPEAGDYRFIDDHGIETGLVISVAEGRVCVRGSRDQGHSSLPEVWHDLAVSGACQGPRLEVEGARMPDRGGSIRLAVNVRTQAYELWDGTEAGSVEVGHVRALTAP